MMRSIELEKEKRIKIVAFWVCVFYYHTISFSLVGSFVFSFCWCKLGFRQRRNGATKSHQQIVRLAQTTGIENSIAAGPKRYVGQPKDFISETTS
jgi:hypothetical protein